MDLEKRIEGLEGFNGVYFKNLKTGEINEFNGDEEFYPASIIKLPILMAVYRLAHMGKLSLREKIKVEQKKKVPCCGAFNAFTDEPLVDIETLCNLMIFISDNTATNLIIERLGIDYLNQQFKEMGLVNTRVERMLFDAEKCEKGYDNKIVPSELGMLLEQVYEGKFVNQDVSNRIFEILAGQQNNTKIPAYIMGKCPIGNKTGEDDGVTGDAALILGENPFILVVITNGTFVPAADEFIRHLARDLYEEIINK